MTPDQDFVSWRALLPIFKRALVRLLEEEPEMTSAQKETLASLIAAAGINPQHVRSSSFAVLDGKPVLTLDCGGVAVVLPTTFQGYEVRQAPKAGQ